MWERSYKKNYHKFPYENFGAKSVQKGQYFIFDIEKDADLVHKIFYYMSTNLPCTHS